MPGPVSDSYDGEWGTGSNRDEIDEALKRVYEDVSDLLDHQPPMYVLDIIRAEYDADGISRVVTPYRRFTEREWRLIRFALERARESL